MVAPQEKFDIAIIGGGISGMSLAFALKRERPGLNVRLFERESTVGGSARSRQQEGFTFDIGPNGFLTNVDHTLQLVEELGLTESLAPAADAAQKRFLYTDGKLQQVPTSPGAFLASSLVSWRAKFGLLGEFWRAPGDPQEDESIYSFVSRRVGKEFAQKLILPMVTGIAGGDARKLSIGAVFPRMKEMEMEHGSLFRALRQRRKQAKREGRTAGGPAGPGGRLTSFQHGGIGFLTQAIAQKLGPDVVHTNASVQRVTPAAQGGFELQFEGQAPLHCSQVILATPSHVAAKILPIPALAEQLQSIEYAPIRVLGLGFVRAEIEHPLDGFGFLVQPERNTRMLGAIWTSSIFPSQAPEDKVLMRLLYGGAWDPDAVALDDEQALALAREELHTILGIKAAPCFVQQQVWTHAIPQYHVGHHQKLAHIDALCAEYPGLFLLGNAYRGLGVNDCTREARALAHRILQTLA